MATCFAGDILTAFPGVDQRSVMQQAIFDTFAASFMLWR